MNGKYTKEWKTGGTEKERQHMKNQQKSNRDRFAWFTTLIEL